MKSHEFITEEQKDLFPDTFANRRSNIRVNKVVSSLNKTNTIRLPNINSANRIISSVKQTLENFWRWFGDSVTVDKKNRPLVFFHGTNRDFQEFKTNIKTYNNYGLLGNVQTTRAGIFITPDVEFAHKYTDRDDNHNQNIIVVYAKVVNPFDLRTGLSNEQWEELKSVNMNPRMVHNVQHIWELFDGDEGNYFVTKLKELGYDGVVFYEENSEVWVVFNSNQLKAVYGNTGSYSSDNSIISEAVLKTSDLRKIIELYRSGKSLSYISNQIGVAGETVRYHLLNQPNYNELKAENERNSTFWNQMRLSQLTNSYRYGMMLQDIADGFGISVPTVKAQLRKLPNIEQLRAEHNLNSTRRVNLDTEQVKQLINYYTSGESVYNISKMMNIDVRALIRFLESHPNYNQFKSEHESNIKYKRIYTPAEVSDIVSQYRDGTTINVIAKKYGVSNDGIESILTKQPNYNELKSENIKNSKTYINWTPELLNKIITMYKNGSTYDSIARETNISIAVLNDKIRKQPNYIELKSEHDVNSAKWTSDKVKQVLDMYDSGMSIPRIASSFGVSVTPIKRIVKNRLD